MDDLATVAAVFSSQERLHELGVPRGRKQCERYWRDGLSIKEDVGTIPGEKWGHINRMQETTASGVTRKWVKDKNKANFDWEDPTRTDHNSVCGRLLRDGGVAPPDCDVIIVHPCGNKLSKMLDEPKFHHLSDEILPFPPSDRGVMKKKYILVGREGNRRPNDGAIMDLINSSFRLHH